MKKPVKKKSERTRLDAQLKEFERRDLGEDIRRSGSGKMLRRSRTTSITLDHDLIEKLSLPLEAIKIIFLNGREAETDSVLHNGDQVALSPVTGAM